MTFPYGTVLRDVTDGEVVMVLYEHDDGVRFWDVLILASSNRDDRALEAGHLGIRAVDLPQWERLP